MTVNGWPWWLDVLLENGEIEEPTIVSVVHIDRKIRTCYLIFKTLAAILYGREALFLIWVNESYWI